MNFKRLLLLAIAAMMFTSLPARAGLLYAITGALHTSSTLYVLDPNTAAVVLTVGSAGVTPPQHIASLAFHPSSGVLYGYINQYVAYNQGQLATINTATGLATVLPQSSPIHVPDMTFSPSGTLYAWTEGGTLGFDKLVTLDPSTGAATLVGGNLGTSHTGLAMNSQGTLYIKPGQDLYTLDPNTGNATFVITLTAALDNVLAFDSNDNLYSVKRANGTSYLEKIDIATGNVTLIGDIGVADISALAFQPATGTTPVTPNTWGTLKRLYR